MKNAKNSFSELNKKEKDIFTISVIKGLIMDTVKNANSGHTGGPMSSSDFAYILFKEYLHFNPDNPNWFNRDRFVLSAGHESALQYVLLTLMGFLKIEDLKNFRQLHSRTPGHPEIEIDGVECTTGPLGQGFGMSVGMALAESFLNQSIKSINEKASSLIDHYTYVVASDGDMQEPITLGSASLAGHLKLSKLIVFYDANDAQISGKVRRSDSTNYEKVFEGFGWNVQKIDGHNHESIRQSIEKAKISDSPSLIIGTTIMAKGCSEMEGDHNTHGAPLPQDEINATKIKLGLPLVPFYLPEEVILHFRVNFKILQEAVKKWDHELLISRRNKNLDRFWSISIENKLPNINYPNFENGSSLATRKAFGATLDHFSKSIPNLIGGSADLEPSNYTGNFASTYGDYGNKNKTGRNIAFGVREFPMAAMMNGASIHGGVIPFGGTFLVFSDYERPALRLAAIQKIRVIHEFTHDSFFVGEDGPTHQPIEHAMALRSIPNFNIFRPGDAKETAVCFKLALENQSTPSALLLTRQGVPVLQNDYDFIDDGVRKGAYIVQDCDISPEIIFIATGSELSLALKTVDLMPDKKIRVVSMPCFEIFDQQSDAYKNDLLPQRGALKVTFEAGISRGWEKYHGPNGLSISIDHYGLSAPYGDLAEEFGFTCEKVEIKIREHLKKLL